MATSAHQHRALSLFEGIILVTLGLAAIFMPNTIATGVLFGCLFLISGITGLATTLWMQQAPGFLWSIVSAILAIVVGILMLLSPTHMLSITLILIVFFTIEGIASIMFALDHKRQLLKPCRWMLLSGIVDLCLAALILFGLPGTAAWALGLLVGINLIFGGAAFVAMAVSASTQGPGPAAPTA